MYECMHDIFCLVKYYTALQDNYHINMFKYYCILFIILCLIIITTSMVAENHDFTYQDFIDCVHICTIDGKFTMIDCFQLCDIRYFED